MVRGVVAHEQISTTLNSVEKRWIPLLIVHKLNCNRTSWLNGWRSSKHMFYLLFIVFHSLKTLTSELSCRCCANLDDIIPPASSLIWSSILEANMSPEAHAHSDEKPKPIRHQHRWIYRLHAALRFESSQAEPGANNSLPNGFHRRRVDEITDSW